MTTTTDLAIRTAARVSAPIESAFDVFTMEIGTWWPLDAYSMRAGRGVGAPDGLHLEPRQGGHLYAHVGAERLPLGTLLQWDPPRRIVLEWQTEPSMPPTEVEVTFVPEGEDTRVEVVHRGWEFMGRSPLEAREAREAFAGRHGWGWLLDRYADAVGD
jgi:uncharacterized protein YndB with AHSA1/START domain